MDSEKAENLVLSNYLTTRKFAQGDSSEVLCGVQQSEWKFWAMGLNLLAEFVQQSSALCKGTLIWAWNDCIFTYSPIPAWKKVKFHPWINIGNPELHWHWQIPIKKIQSSLKYFSIFVWMSIYAGSLKCCFQRESTVFILFQISSSTWGFIGPLRSLQILVTEKHSTALGFGNTLE